MEVFSGKARLTEELNMFKGQAETFEILNEPQQNILTDVGLVLLLRLLLRVHEGGLAWFGVPCQSWIALSRSFTARSSLQPAGPPAAYTRTCQRGYLDCHNAIATRVSLAIRTATLLGVKWASEQPLSSLLFEFETIKQVVQTSGVFLGICSHGEFQR